MLLLMLLVEGEFFEDGSRKVAATRDFCVSSKTKKVVNKIRPKLGCRSRRTPAAEMDKFRKVLLIQSPLKISLHYRRLSSAEIS